MAATVLVFGRIYRDVTPNVLLLSTGRGSHFNKTGQENRTVVAARLEGLLLALGMDWSPVILFLAKFLKMSPAMCCSLSTTRGSHVNELGQKQKTMLVTAQRCLHSCKRAVPTCLLPAPKPDVRALQLTHRRRKVCNKGCTLKMYVSFV